MRRRWPSRSSRSRSRGGSSASARSSSSRRRSAGFGTFGATSTLFRWNTHTISAPPRRLSAVKEGGSNGAPDLTASYATAFAAYLADRGERELGAAYDLGRQAVAAHLSVLDLAEAHHAAVRAALGDGSPPEATLQAAAAFLRESLSIFESVHRGYSEVREVARVEHEHVEQLRALADVSVALNSSLTVEEILQLTADAARDLIGGTRAKVAIFAPDPRLRPLTATSPPLA